MAQSNSTVKIGSAGRARWAAALPSPIRESDANSYCFICAHWHFGQLLLWCPRCNHQIFRIIPTDDLRHFQSRTSLSGY